MKFSYSIVLFALFAVLLVSGCTQQTITDGNGDNVDQTPPSPAQPPIDDTDGDGTEPSLVPPADGDADGNTIEISAAGFSPRELTISAGETVTFVNKVSSRHWPASAVHPTHTVYPESDIRKCGTSEASDIFDACRELSQGESYSFAFNERGSWRYHDHLRPSLTGIIVVE